MSLRTWPYLSKGIARAVQAQGRRGGLVIVVLCCHQEDKGFGFLGVLLFYCVSPWRKSSGWVSMVDWYPEHIGRFEVSSY